MGDNFDITNARTRHRSGARLMGALAGIVFLLAACGSTPASSPEVALGAATLRTEAPTVELAVASPTPEPVPTATAVPTPTPAPELPPAVADDGEPITDNIVMSEALGLTDVCSLYEDVSRLSELLGDFWTMTPGVPVDQKCLWVSAKASESSAVVSIQIRHTDDVDNNGTTIRSDEIGPGLAVSMDGTEYVVNVVTDDVDATVAALNVREAEERIAADLLARTEG